MYDIGFRQAVLRAYAHIKNFRKLGVIFGVSPSTICRWNKASTSEKTLGRPSKITEPIKQFIRTYLAEHPFVTALRLSVVLRSVFGQKFSRQLVTVAIRSAGMSRVKVRRQVIRDVDEHRHKVDVFLRSLVAGIRAGSNFVFVDETGFSDIALPMRGYVRKGQRLYVKCSSSSWCRISVAAAISEQGAVMTSSAKGTFGSKNFARFLSDLNLPSGAILVMDNAAFHKTVEVLNVIRQKGWKVLFTPPYCPWYNPIENVFGCVTMKYRNLRAECSDSPRGSEGMLRHILEAFDTAASTSDVESCVRRFWEFAACDAASDRGVTMPR